MIIDSVSGNSDGFSRIAELRIDPRWGGHGTLARTESRMLYVDIEGRAVNVTVGEPSVGCDLVADFEFDALNLLALDASDEVFQAAQGAAARKADVSAVATPVWVAGLVQEVSRLAD